MFYVYLIQSISSPDKKYIGCTSDLTERVQKHNEGGSVYTADHKPWKLVTYIAFDDKHKAFEFEKYLKTCSGRAFAKKEILDVKFRPVPRSLVQRGALFLYSLGMIMIFMPLENELMMRKKSCERVMTYSTPLISRGENIKNPDIGSGTFVRMCGGCGILTNAHVADVFRKKSLQYVTIPGLNDDSIILKYNLILYGRRIDQEYTSDDINDIDLAFICLTEESCQKVLVKGMQFFDLDGAFSMWKYSVDKGGPVIYNIYGAVAEGMKFSCKGGGKNELYYPNAGVYTVVPDLANNVSRKNLTSVDNIICPIQTKESVPRHFEGMSGGGLWKCIFNSKDELTEIFLMGVATQYAPENRAKKITCRGPNTLYEMFYKKCRANSHLFERSRQI